MGIISYALKGNLGNFLKKLDKVSEETKMSKLKLFNKFLKCFMMQGFGYSDYLNYELYLKTKKEIKEYASIKDQDKFYEIVSPSRYKTFFTIKPEFLKNFKDYVARDFFYEGTIVELKTFLDNNPEFMIKPIDGLGGRGVDKMFAKQVTDVEAFFTELKENRLFLEGYVIQHPDLMAFCQESVNTIRILTFNYKEHSEVLFATLRVGNGNAAVDNFHKGGMALLIDLETGKLVGEAVDKDLNRYSVHPKSKIKFEGFKIPNWDIVKKTVLEASKVNSHIHVVGWDVAVTEDGCTLIEGNRRPGFDIVQVTSGFGRKDLMRKVLEKINEEEHTDYKI